MHQQNWPWVRLMYRYLECLYYSCLASSLFAENATAEDRIFFLLFGQCSVNIWGELASIRCAHEFELTYTSSSRLDSIVCSSRCTHTYLMIFNCFKLKISWIIFVQFIYIAVKLERCLHRLNVARLKGQVKLLYFCPECISYYVL